MTPGEFKPGRAEQISTRIVFFIAGLGMAAWAPLVPFAKARASIDERMLGFLLLCLGAGSIVAMPLMGVLASRKGCRFAIVLTAIMICVSLPVLAAASQFYVLMGALLLFGAGVGGMDVAMNIQAIIVERAGERPMMSGFHGMFSLGGIVGAAAVVGLLRLGASPLTAVYVLLFGIVVLMALGVSHLLPYGSHTQGPYFALPHGIVLFLGLLCFVVFMMEGAVLDWSAWFLTSVHKVNPADAGLGYAAFALTMTLGRLMGDLIVRRLGGNKVIVFGGLCAALGVGLTLLPWLGMALLGYALIGAGCSNIVPVLFTSVGRQKVMPENLAVPAITTLGYAGILLGPAGIGFVAHLSNISVAFGLMAILLLAVAVSGRFLRL